MNFQMNEFHGIGIRDKYKTALITYWGAFV